MNEKQQRIFNARDQMAHLTHLCMRLQRCREKDVGHLLEEAEQCLQRYKLNRFIKDDATGGVIEDDVPPELEPSMKALAEVIGDTVKPYGFSLLVFGMEDHGGRMNYISNCHIDDVCRSMHEFVAAAEKGKG